MSGVKDKSSLYPFGTLQAPTDARHPHIKELVSCLKNHHTDSLCLEI